MYSVFPVDVFEEIAHQTSVCIQRFPLRIHISSPLCSRNWMEQSLALEANNF